MNPEPVVMISGSGKCYHLNTFLKITSYVCETLVKRNTSKRTQCYSAYSVIAIQSSLFSTSQWQPRVSSLLSSTQPRINSLFTKINQINSSKWEWRPRLQIRGFAEDIPKKYNVYKERHIDIENEEIALAKSRLVNEAGNGYLMKKNRFAAENMAPVSEEVILRLEDTFGMTFEEALRVVRSPKFFLVADAAILETINCLGDFGITAERVKRSPWLLLQAADDFTEKISLITEEYLFQNYFEGLGFCYFSKSKIRWFQRFFQSESQHFPEHTNRLYCMADKLMIPVDQLVDEIVKVNRLNTMNFHRIESFINILNKFEIRREDILKDLWIFFNNIDLAERRLQRVIDAGCTRPKLWMCRCPEDVFEITVSRYQAKKDALGDCNTLEEYLMKRLNCTAEDLANQLEFNESLKTVNIAKIQRVIDMLYSEGISSYQILHSLRILKYSEKRTSMRIKRLKDLGMTSTSIPIVVLYKSPISFEIYCESLADKGHRKP